jgi:type II secretory pathway pseudopilin PulG
MSALSHGWRHIWRVPSEQGDTLIEVLIALVIMSLAVVALLGGLVSSITSSAEHRSLSTIDTVLKSYAETAKYDIELQPSPWYLDCASVTSSTSTYKGVTGPQVISAPSLPAGWSTSLTIQYWNTKTDVLDPLCQPNDYQLLTLGVTGANGVSQTLTLGLRSPT